MGRKGADGRLEARSVLVITDYGAIWMKRGPRDSLRACFGVVKGGSNMRVWSGQACLRYERGGGAGKKNPGFL